MKVLVACEESQAVCKEFRRKGHEAYSCDIQPCSGGHPEWHIQDDVTQYLKMPWDLVIAHPPCTYLTVASAVCMFPGHQLNAWRFAQMQDAAEFFRLCLNANSPRVCVENPVPLALAELPPYTQIIEPWYFGDPYLKRTCLWLKGLPELVSENPWYGDVTCWVSGGSFDKYGNRRRRAGQGFRDAKTRSKTFPGIARAMANQWGSEELLYLF